MKSLLRSPCIISTTCRYLRVNTVNAYLHTFFVIPPVKWFYMHRKTQLRDFWLYPTEICILFTMYNYYYFQIHEANYRILFHCCNIVPRCNSAIVSHFESLTNKMFFCFLCPLALICFSVSCLYLDSLSAFEFGLGNCDCLYLKKFRINIMNVLHTLQNTVNYQ